MNNIVEQIEVDKYFALAKTIIPNMESLSVVDRSGKNLWSNTSIDEQCAKAMQGSIQLYFKREDIPNIFKSKLNDERSLILSVLTNAVDEPIGSLVFIFNTNINIRDFRDKIGLISSLLMREIHLNAELTSMSIELEERYEELNLVYESDDQTIENESGPDALEELVKNCTDYLDVAMTALILPREELTLFSLSDNGKIHYVHSILIQLKNYAFRWVEKNKRSIVSNDLTDIFRQDVFPDIPYKIVCSPIFVANNTLGGIIVTLNPSHSTDFTNSDRNLLEAMAKKAAKIAMANYDSLTGLFKRNAFEVALEKALNKARSEARVYSVLHVDLDGIKVINDTISTKAGDALLFEVGKLIREKIRDTDIVARLSGDNYGILLDACSLETGCTIADNIRKSIYDMHFVWDNQSIDTSACIGVANLNADSENIESVIAASELATSIAKEHGRNIVQVYQQADTVLQRRKGEVHWIREIQKSLKLDMFRLFCQPIIPLGDTKGPAHFEVLIRMIGANGDIITPDNFIPAAERYRLVSSLDEWVIKNTFKMINQNYTTTKNYVWTINLSGLSVQQNQFSEKIISFAKEYAINPEIICFELTETFAMNNLDEVKEFTLALRDQGFSVALDDFGTGSSTFSYLKQIPVNYLKIDGSFISDIVNDPFAEEIVRAISKVSSLRDISTVAEYVENDQILQLIEGLGVNYAQGYGVGKPKELDETIDQLATKSFETLLYNKSA